MITRTDIEKFYKDVETLELRFPVAEIARKTGENKSTISRVLSKAIEPSESLIKRFYESFANNLKQENIVEEAPTTYLSKRRDIKNNSKSDIPVFTGNTRAGTIEVYSDDPTVNEPVGHLPATIFPGCNHAEKVSGDSMHPIVINQGFVIGKIIDKKGIIYGEKYIIHTKYGMSMVKYIQSGTEKNLIKLVSYNKHIVPQEIPFDDIIFCCRIYFIVNPS